MNAHAAGKQVNFFVLPHGVMCTHVHTHQIHNQFFVHPGKHIWMELSPYDVAGIDFVIAFTFGCVGVFVCVVGEAILFNLVTIYAPWHSHQVNGRNCWRK